MEGVSNESIQRFDGLMRPVLAVENSADPTQVAVQRFEYDSAGRKYFIEGPFFAPRRTDAYFASNSASSDRNPWVMNVYATGGQLRAVVTSDAQSMVKCAGGEDCLSRSNVENANSRGRTGPVTMFGVSGLVQTTTNPDGRVRTSVFDHIGRVVEVRDTNDAGLVETTKYSYSPAGQIARVTDARGRVLFDVEYDTLGNRRRVIDADLGSIRRRADGTIDESMSRVWEYEYDALGRALWARDPNGRQQWFQYDVRGRLESSCFGGSLAQCSDHVFYGFQDTGSGSGALKSIENYTATKTVVDYDGFGRPKTLAFTIAGDPQTYRVVRTFDAFGRLKTLQYPDLYEVTYEYYGGTALLAAVKGRDVANVGPSGPQVVIASLSLYQPTGVPGQITFGNGVRTRYTPDPWNGEIEGVITETSHPTGNPRDDIVNTGLQYSPGGALGGILDYREADRRGLSLAQSSWTFTRDSRGRVSSERGPAYAIGSAQAGSTLYEPHVHRAHALQSQITSASFEFTYDQNGHPLSGYDLSNAALPAYRTFAWNPDGTLSRASRGAASIDALYDGVGDRVVKISGGKAIHYIGPYCDVEFDNTGKVMTRYVFAGPMRIAVMSRGRTFFLHKDTRGNTVAATDETGTAPVWSASYSVFGEIRAESGTRVTRYLFSDHEYDAETRLYYMGARYYDPSIGRFISPDDQVPRPWDSQSFNRYAYAHNDPLSFQDRDGHADGVVCWTVSGGPPYTTCGSSGGGGSGTSWDYEYFTGGLSPFDPFRGIGGAGWHAGPWGPVASPPVANAPKPPSIRVATAGAVVLSALPAARYAPFARPELTLIGGGRAASFSGAPAGAIAAAPMLIADDTPDPYERKLLHATYILINWETGQYYVGRTSGSADDYVWNVVARRYTGHAYAQCGFTMYAWDAFAVGPSGKQAIRGREQQLIDFFTVTYPGLIANKIRGVSSFNIAAPTYHQASNRWFGYLAPYTGLYPYDGFDAEMPWPWPCRRGGAPGVCN